MEPPCAGPARLPAVDVGHRHDERSAGTQQAMALGEHDAGVMKMLEHLPGGDGIEAPGGESTRRDGPDPDFPARALLGSPRGRFVELRAADGIPEALHHAQEEAAPATASEGEDPRTSAFGELCQPSEKALYLSAVFEPERRGRAVRTASDRVRRTSSRRTPHSHRRSCGIPRKAAGDSGGSRAR